MTATRMQKTYFGQFTYEAATAHDGKDIYYDHLPVYTGGNLYLMGPLLMTESRISLSIRNIR